MEIEPRDFLNIFLRFWPFEPHIHITFFLIKVMCNLRKILCHLICTRPMLQSIWQQCMCTLLDYVPSQCHLTLIVCIALDCNVEKQLGLVISKNKRRLITIFAFPPDSLCWDVVWALVLAPDSLVLYSLYPGISKDATCNVEGGRND